MVLRHASRLYLRAPPSLSARHFSLCGTSVAVRPVQTWAGHFKNAIGPSTLVTHFQSRPTWPGHLAFLLSGVSFLLTDMLWLRVFASMSCMLTILFNYYHPVGRVIFLPIQWNCFYICVNLVYIIHLIEMRMARLNYFEERIFTQFFQDAMSVYEFQRLMSFGTMGEAQKREQVFTIGQCADQVILVFNGSPEVEIEAGRTFLGRPGLLGEISYLTGEAATASVYLVPGVQYIKWQRKDLEYISTYEPVVSRGLEHAMCKELARKLSTMNRRFKMAEQGQRSPPQHSSVDMLEDEPKSTNTEIDRDQTPFKDEAVALTEFARGASDLIQYALLNAVPGECRVALDHLIHELGDFVADARAKQPVKNNWDAKGDYPRPLTLAEMTMERFRRFSQRNYNAGFSKPQE